MSTYQVRLRELYDHLTGDGPATSYWLETAIGLVDLVADDLGVDLSAPEALTGRSQVAPQDLRFGDIVHLDVAYPEQFVGPLTVDHVSDLGRLGLVAVHWQDTSMASLWFNPSLTLPVTRAKSFAVVGTDPEGPWLDDGGPS